jgi:ParB-like chromosome segregation protein Spo0J
MGWRDKYKVHPAADVFPMMSDEELAALGEDIKKNGLKHAILGLKDSGEVIDGRNRLEAMERAGIYQDPQLVYPMDDGDDPVSFVISLNIHRRHLTKAQQADLVVAAIKAGEKPVQVEPVSKGGRGKKNPVKDKALAAAKDHGISESTIKRSLAKAEGRTPQRKPKKSQPPNTGCNYDPADPRAEDEGEPIADTRRRAWLNMASSAKEMAESFLSERDHRALAVADADEIDEEVSTSVWDAYQAWGRVHRLMAKKRRVTLPQDGRSEVAVDDPTPPSALFATLETELKKRGSR